MGTLPLLFGYTFTGNLQSVDVKFFLVQASNKITIF